MDWHPFAFIALGILGKWLHERALKLRAKSAAQADSLLGAGEGAAQGILDATADALVKTGADAINKAK